MLVAMSKLEAVNTMLLSIGQAPVNTITDTGITDVEIAVQFLDNALREVQTRAWDFNFTSKYEIALDGSSHALVPAGVLSIDSYYESQRLVWRDDSGTAKLFDLEDQTFVMKNDPTLVNVIWGYDFDETPQYCRNYVATRAMRRFQAYMIGSPTIFEFTRFDEENAWAELRKHAVRNREVNILRDGDPSNQIFQRRVNVNRW
jgi:hypothetical protein